MADDDIEKARQVINEQLTALHEIQGKWELIAGTREFEMVSRWQDVTAKRIASAISEKERNWFTQTWHSIKVRGATDETLRKFLDAAKSHLEVLLEELDRNPESIVSPNRGVPRQSITSLAQPTTVPEMSPDPFVERADEPAQSERKRFPTGMTFWDYLNHAGPWLAFFVVAALIVIWIVAHHLAQPGTSVLGLYTKGGAPVLETVPRDRDDKIKINIPAKAPSLTVTKTLDRRGVTSSSGCRQEVTGHRFNVSVAGASPDAVGYLWVRPLSNYRGQPSEPTAVWRSGQPSISVPEAVLVNRSELVFEVRDRGQSGSVPIAEFTDPDPKTCQTWQLHFLNATIVVAR